MRAEERKPGLAGDFRLEQQEQEQMWNVIKTGKFIDMDIVEIMLPITIVEVCILRSRANDFASNRDRK